MNKKLIISFIAVGLLLTACGNSKSTTVKIKTTPTPAAGVIITDSSTSSDILGTLPAHSVISYFTGLDKTTNNALVAEFTSSNCIETGVQFKNYPTYSMVPLGIDTKAFDFLSKYKYVNYQSTASDFWVKDGMSTTAKFVKDDSYKGKMLPVFADLESLYGSSAPTVCNIFAGLKAKLEPTIVPFDDTYNFEDKANAQKQIADPKNKDKIKVYVASFDSLKNYYEKHLNFY